MVNKKRTVTAAISDCVIETNTEREEGSPDFMLTIINKGRTFHVTQSTLNKKENYKIVYLTVASSSCCGSYSK